MSNLLISPLVSQQLPEFIRGEYPKFVTFIEKYYEWMEQSGNVISATDEFSSGLDIDTASDYYINRIQTEFLSFFPKDIQLDKRKFAKIINQFYSAKGTPNSVKFLFRAMFNEEIDIYYPKEDILKVSDGKWLLPLALRVDTDDDRIFNIEKCLLTGQTSKATALVEKVVRSIDRQLGIIYTELYISNIERLFTTGEKVYATYTDPNTLLPVTITSKLIGALSEIKIKDAPIINGKLVEPNPYRGLDYIAYDAATGYPGDPVTIIGGLNPQANNPIGAIAYVGEATKGSITDVIVTNGGFGFRDPTIPGFANTSIIDFKGGFDGVTFGTEAKAQIQLVDSAIYRNMNVALKTIETFYSHNISEFEANTIISLSDLQTINVHPISFIQLVGGGGGYKTKPSVDIYSYYNEDIDDTLIMTNARLIKGSFEIFDYTQDFTESFEKGDVVRIYVKNRYEDIREIKEVTTNAIIFYEAFKNDIPPLAESYSVQLYKINRNELKKTGSLGRIEIVDPGEGYAVGEYLNFSAPVGYGANAKITAVHTGNNGIKTVTMQTPANNEYIIGGEGYSSSSLPTITINTVAGANAILRVTELAGDGEQLSLSASRIGAISKIRVVSYGYDYVSAPTISLRNADLLLNNVTEGQIFSSGSLAYQGVDANTATFKAYVESYSQTTNKMRIYDYKGIFNKNITIKSDDGPVSANIQSYQFYGDGNAKATAKFENGLIRLPGLYINDDGQISSNKKIQGPKKYHNFSYDINTTKSYSEFESTLKNVIHPVGTKSFITRIDPHNENISMDDYYIVLSNNAISVTLNIANGSNSIITSSSLVSEINVGDIIVLTNVSHRLSGTVNVQNNSNNVTGLDTNFLNINDGDLIYISTGNTEIVKSVIDSTNLVINEKINVTSTGAFINIIFDEVKTVTNVNSTVIMVDTAFSTNSNNIISYVHKVK